MPLPRAFFQRPDPVQIARELLGKYLVSDIDGRHTAGFITETEAYSGERDAACHAHAGRRTPRNQIMYGRPGLAYVYLCYGLHPLFNIVTNEEEHADAVLIRAIEPTEGVDIMLHRRGKLALSHALTAGPGSLSKALGITTQHYGLDLTDPTSPVRVEDRGLHIPEADILATPRIGVDYAGDDAWLPWRFTIRGNKWVTATKLPKIPHSSTAHPADVRSQGKA